MEQILAYITQYGPSVFVIASCIIFFIGILKVCKVFTKINNAQVKKFVYYILNVALAFGCAAIYFVSFKLNWSEYVFFSCAQVSATTTLYAIYENLGARKIVQIVLSKIAEWIKKNPERKTAKALKNLGLTEEMLNKLQAIAIEENNKDSAPVVTSNTVTSTSVYNRTNR